MHRMPANGERGNEGQGQLRGSALAKTLRGRTRRHGRALCGWTNGRTGWDQRSATEHRRRSSCGADTLYLFLDMGTLALLRSIGRLQGICLRGRAGYQRSTECPMPRFEVLSGTRVRLSAGHQPPAHHRAAALGASPGGSLRQRCSSWRLELRLRPSPPHGRRDGMGDGRWEPERWVAGWGSGVRRAAGPRQPRRCRIRSTRERCSGC